MIISDGFGTSPFDVILCEAQNAWRSTCSGLLRVLLDGILDQTAHAKLSGLLHGWLGSALFCWELLVVGVKRRSEEVVRSSWI